MFCRGRGKESSVDTLRRMAQFSPKGTLIVADSYFGSFKSLIGLIEDGYFALLSCRKDRPRSVFSNFLCHGLPDQQSASAFGEYNRIPFVAAVTRDEKKFVCTLSTHFGDSEITEEVDQIVEDDTEEHQGYLKRKPQVRVEARARYAKLMDLVDKADAEIFTALSTHKKGHWTSAELIWILTMMLQVNARKLYESSNATYLSADEWLLLLIENLSNFNDHHIQKAQKRKRRAYCKPCYHLKKKRSRTVWECKACLGAVCKQCDSDGSHEKFVKNGRSLNRHRLSTPTDDVQSNNLVL